MGVKMCWGEVMVGKGWVQVRRGRGERENNVFDVTLFRIVGMLSP